MTSALPAVNSSVLPGQRLCAINTSANTDNGSHNNKCGVGTYEHHGHIHASLAGRLSVKRVTPDGAGDGNGTGKNGTSVLEVSILR